ncbi:hypothetical protein ACK38U_09425 [Aeromonas veronii]
MKIDLENKVVELQGRRFEIPSLVVEALQGDLDINEEHLNASNQFLSTLKVKRIGFNGLRVDNYYEFIFKVDGDKLIDNHSEKYKVNTIIDSVSVRIGSPTDFSILVIGCKNPFMKSYYVENNLYHYISISFSTKETKALAILQYAKALVNRILSKGNSYLSPDDVFKPESDSDNLDDDFGFDEPSLTELVDEFQSFKTSCHHSNNDYKLYDLIAMSYKIKKESRFMSYFKILEYLARNHKVSNGASKFSKYLFDMDINLKQEVVSELGGNVTFDDMVEYIRNTRNVLTHPTAKYKNGTVLFPFKKSIDFQRVVISKIVGFKI